MSNSESDSDDVPQLPADTLAILKDFQRENAQKSSNVKMLIKNGADELPVLEISEDWQLSQFWYDEFTANTLSQEALRCAGDSGRIALISCPTLYPTIMKSKGPNVTVFLFEYDSRFSIYGKGFVSYDYNRPLDVPCGMERSFDVVIADPPFLSEECLVKVSETVRYLSKDKVILCSGVVMQKHAKKLLDLDKRSFVPQHKNNLGNEFACFANYDFDKYL